MSRLAFPVNNQGAIAIINCEPDSLSRLCTTKTPIFYSTQTPPTLLRGLLLESGSTLTPSSFESEGGVPFVNTLIITPELIAAAAGATAASLRALKPKGHSSSPPPAPSSSDGGAYAGSSPAPAASHASPSSLSPAASTPPALSPSAAGAGAGAGAGKDGELEVGAVAPPQVEDMKVIQLDNDSVAVLQCSPDGRYLAGAYRLVCSDC